MKKDFSEVMFEVIRKAFKGTAIRRFIIYFIPLVMVNILIRYILSFNVLPKIPSMLIQYISLAAIAGVVILLIYWSYEESKAIELKYHVKLNLVSGGYDYICNKEELEKLLEWHESGEEIYIIKVSNGFIRVTKNNLVELRYSEISKLRQLVEPVLYVLYHPVPEGLGFKTFINLLLVGLGAIAAYMLYNKIPLESLIKANGKGFGWFMNFQYSIISIFAIYYVYQGIVKFLSLKGNNLSTYAQTVRFKLGNSILGNTFMIIIFPYFVTGLVKSL